MATQHEPRWRRSQGRRLKSRVVGAHATIDGSCHPCRVGDDAIDVDTARKLLERTGRRLARHVTQSRGRDRAIQRPLDPQAAAAKLRPLTETIPIDAPSLLERVEAVTELVLEYSVATNHPRFFNQNFAGPDPLAIAGDWITAALNTNMATYEMAPVLTVMEYEMLGLLARRAGLVPDGDEPVRPEGLRRGVFVPGGSMAILHAMILARHRAAPEVDEHGIAALHGAGQLDRPLCLFTSAQSHYSLGKGAMALGLGRRCVHKVPCDERGRMRPEALESALDEAETRGQRPFMVNATAGTTVAGAFDPVDAIAEICRARGLWLHVDGCFGASALMSTTHRVLLRGVEQADSLSWNPHKMLGMTQQCSVLLVREPRHLAEVFAGGADYLFQPEKPHAELDGGDLALSCARRADVLKLWLSHAVHGVEGFGARIDRAHDHARALAARVVDDPRFALAWPANPFNVCFWWVPPALRPFDTSSASPEQLEQLAAATRRIKAGFADRGEVMVGYAQLPERPDFFRMLFMNPDVQTEDIERLLGEIDDLGQAGL